MPATVDAETGRTAGSVLVLTEPADSTADLVVRELDRLGTHVFRADTGDFPLALSVSAWFDEGWHGELRSADGSLDLDDIRGIYVRRPTVFSFPHSMTDSERRFAAREARQGIGGLPITPDGEQSVHLPGSDRAWHLPL